MALSRDTLRDRILAAALLQGYGGMRGLRRALVDYDAEMTLAEAVIRGDKVLRGRNLRDLCAVLGVPPEWFTAEDWRSLIRSPAALPGAYPEVEPQTHEERRRAEG